LAIAKIFFGIDDKIGSLPEHLSLFIEQVFDIEEKDR